MFNSITDERIQNTSTVNLLKMLRIVRHCVISYDRDRDSREFDLKQDEYEQELFERLKKELAKRPHVPRKRKDVIAQQKYVARCRKAVFEKMANAELLNRRFSD